MARPFGLVAGGACLAIVLLLALDAALLHVLEPVDAAVRAWARDEVPAPLRAKLAGEAGRAGSAATTLLVVGAMAVVAWGQGRRVAAALVVAASVATALLAFALGRLLDAFPSGHAARVGSTMALLVLVVVAPWRPTHARAYGALVLVALALALGTGLARVLGDAEGASDVVGGFALGAGFAAVAAGLGERLSPRARDTSPAPRP